jgi:hypothetical protein
VTADLLFLPLGVVAGALTQRVTGVGFALVCAPLLVLIAGPFEGVVLANLLSLTVNLVRVRRGLAILNGARVSSSRYPPSCSSRSGPGWPGPSRPLP